MGHRPLCSLVVPAYNMERYVAETVESALAQTYRPLEIVIVDDGSTDGTAAIAKSYLDQPEVVYVFQENRGLAGARNRGIAESHGEYIVLLDADDVWMPQKVERAVDHLETHPDVGWLTTDCYLLREETRTEERYYGTFVPDEFPVGARAQLDMIAKRNYMSVACIIRRSLFDRFGVFDEQLRRSEDYDLWIRFLLGGTSVARIPEPLGWYRLHGASLSADPHAQWDSHLTVMERHLPALWARGARGNAREYHDIARKLARRGDRSNALRFAWMAVRAPDLSFAGRLKTAASLSASVIGGRS
jgi:glycosyltransferase involved in cell wall biosynthesis